LREINDEELDRIIGADKGSDDDRDDRADFEVENEGHRLGWGDNEVTEHSRPR